MKRKGVATSLVSVLVLVLLVRQCSGVAKGSTAGVQLKLDDTGPLEERFAALYAQVKPGLKVLSRVEGTDHQQCAHTAFKKLLEAEKGTIPTEDVLKITNVKGEEVERYMLSKKSVVGFEEEELVPRVHVYRERNWGLFMKEIGSMDSPKASFGTCWAHTAGGEAEELLVLGRLVRAEEEGQDAIASFCTTLLASAAFPDCPFLERASLGSSDHATLMVRKAEGEPLCGVVKLFLGMHAERIFNSEAVLEKAFSSLQLEHSQFCTSQLSSQHSFFIEAHPECAGLRIRAYMPAKGESAVLKQLSSEQQRLANIEYGRYIGRVLGELHREGKVFLAMPEVIQMDPRVRLQTHTVTQTVNGMIEKFYSVSEGDYEFDAVGVSSLLYELEQCVKRHPRLQELLTAVHGDLTPYNVFAAVEEVLFKDPTGVFEDVLYPRPTGTVTLIDYGEGGVGVGVGEVYYALTLMVMQGMPDGATVADTITAVWSSYEEENPVTIAPIVKRYYRYMALLALSWRATVLDVRSVLPEFSFQEKHTVQCEDHDLILQQVLDSFTTLETPEELEQRFDTALDKLVSSHLIDTDVDVFNLVFLKRHHAP